MSELSFVARPSIIGDTSFKIDFEGRDLYQNTIKRYSTGVVNTEEEAVRACLVKLGWSPPVEDHEVRIILRRRDAEGLKTLVQNEMREDESLEYEQWRRRIWDAMSHIGLR